MDTILHRNHRNTDHHRMFHIYMSGSMLSSWEAMQCNDSISFNALLLFSIITLHKRSIEISKKLYLYIRLIILFMQCLQKKDIFCFINIACYISTWKRNRYCMRNRNKHDLNINTFTWLFMQNISLSGNGMILHIMIEKFIWSGYLWRTNWMNIVTLHRTQFIYIYEWDIPSTIHCSFMFWVGLLLWN